MPGWLGTPSPWLVAPVWLGAITIGAASGSNARTRSGIFGGAGAGALGIGAGNCRICRIDSSLSFNRHCHGGRPGDACVSVTCSVWLVQTSSLDLSYQSTGVASEGLYCSMRPLSDSRVALFHRFVPSSLIT